LLGQQLEQVNISELQERIDALVTENRDIASQLTNAEKENTTLRSQVVDHEEDVAAARTGLARMIRQQSSRISNPPEQALDS